eukprot:4160969-Amphidinium_carterae.1
MSASNGMCMLMHHKETRLCLRQSLKETTKETYQQITLRGRITTNTRQTCKGICCNAKWNADKERVIRENILTKAMRGSAIPTDKHQTERKRVGSLVSATCDLRPRFTSSTTHSSDATEHNLISCNRQQRLHQNIYYLERRDFLVRGSHADEAYEGRTPVHIDKPRRSTGDMNKFKGKYTNRKGKPYQVKGKGRGYNSYNSGVSYSSYTNRYGRRNQAKLQRWKEQRQKQRTTTTTTTRRSTIQRQEQRKKKTPVTRLQATKETPILHLTVNADNEEKHLTTESMNLRAWCDNDNTEYTAQELKKAIKEDHNSLQKIEVFQKVRRSHYRQDQLSQVVQTKWVIRERPWRQQEQETQGTICCKRLYSSIYIEHTTSTYRTLHSSIHQYRKVQQY